MAYLIYEIVVTQNPLAYSLKPTGLSENPSSGILGFKSQYAAAQFPASPNHFAWLVVPDTQPAAKSAGVGEEVTVLGNPMIRYYMNGFIP